MPTLVPATDADIPGVVQLMNRAYRPQNGAAGWATETSYIDGDRTSEALFRADLTASPAANLLLWRLPSGHLQGSVWLEPLAGDQWYLGSLTVDPSAQNAGHGRQLLTAAEDWIQSHGGRDIKITVVNVRDTLIAWYMRRGYQPTGETEPFPYDDTRFGTPKRPDLCFTILRKSLG
jgi:GNAT superfamily N-acetyltransferase